MCEEKPYAAAAQNARRRGRLWGPRGRTADTAMRTLWTAAPVARVLGRGGAASASTSARGGSSDLARQKSDGTIDEDSSSFDAGAPRVGRVDAWRELGFSSAREMREQHGSDLHRHNRRRLRAGRAPVTEAEFLQKNEDGDLSSISGSDENDATDSDHSDSDEDAEHASVSRHAEKFRASKGAGEGAQMVVEAEDGSKFGVWRCLVFPPGRDVNAAAARDKLVALQRIEASERKPWVVILARGGHFAASAFEPEKFFCPKDKAKGDDEKAPLSERFLNELVPASAAVAHKTFHRYVVRAKAGGRQSGKDGGGKTIKAGEFVAETEEEKEKRRARVKAKLNKYREEAGITVDNGTRSRWNVALTECKTLMRLGKLVEARDIVEPIVLLEEINPRTALGGEITFHYAMCLDNTQRRDEALEMYKRCVGNPHGQVSKQADRMIWGMTTASTKMKADQFDYDAIKDKYDPFLIKMTTERQDWKIETDPEEEETLAKITYGAIAAVMAIPVAFGLFLAAR